MPVLFFFAIVLIGIVFLFSSRFDLFSPSMVLISSFLLTSLSSIYFYLLYDYSFSLITFFTLLFSIVLFICGERIASGSYSKDGLSKVKIVHPKIFKQSTLLLFAFLCLGVITIYQQYIHLIEAGSLFTKSDNFFKLAAMSRICTVNPSECSSLTVPLSLKFGLVLTRAMTLIVVLIYFYNKIVLKLEEEQRKYFCLLFVFIYLIQLGLSTSRIGYIYFFIFSFICWGGLKYLVAPSKFQLAKMVLRKAVIFIFLFSFLFYGLGYITLKSDEMTFIDMITKYTGLQIYALDNYLNSECSGTCAPYGTETFWGVGPLLYKIGLIQGLSPPNLPYSQLNEHAINIYTGYRRYISDYGYTGLFIINFLLGIFYGFLYKIVKRYTFFPFSFAIYSAVVYPVFMMAWDERFTNVLIANHTFIQIIVMYLIYKSFIVRTSRQVRNLHVKFFI